MTFLIVILYSKGRIFSLSRRADCPGVIFSPSLMIRLSLTISIWNFTILVAIPKVPKKLVCLGSRPVGPALIVTSIGAIEPTLAGASLTYESKIFVISISSPLVKTIEEFPFNYEIILSR